MLIKDIVNFVNQLRKNSNASYFIEYDAVYANEIEELIGNQSHENQIDMIGQTTPVNGVTLNDFFLRRWRQIRGSRYDYTIDPYGNNEHWIRLAYDISIELQTQSQKRSFLQVLIPDLTSEKDPCLGVKITGLPKTVKLYVTSNDPLTHSINISFGSYVFCKKNNRLFYLKHDKVLQTGCLDLVYTYPEDHPFITNLPQLMLGKTECNLFMSQVFEYITKYSRHIPFSLQELYLSHNKKELYDINFLSHRVMNEPFLFTQDNPAITTKLRALSLFELFQLRAKKEYLDAFYNNLWGSIGNVLSKSRMRESYYGKFNKRITSVGEYPQKATGYLILLIDSFFSIDTSNKTHDILSTFDDFLQTCHYEDANYLYSLPILLKSKQSSSSPSCNVTKKMSHSYSLCDILLDCFALEFNKKNISTQDINGFTLEDKLLGVGDWLAHYDPTVLGKSQLLQALYAQLKIGQFFDFPSLTLMIRQLEINGFPSSNILKKLRELTDCLITYTKIEPPLIKILEELYALRSNEIFDTEHDYFRLQTGINEPWIYLAQILESAGWITNHYRLLIATFTDDEDRFVNEPLTHYNLSHFIYSDSKQPILLDACLQWKKQSRILSNPYSVPCREFTPSEIKRFKYTNRKFIKLIPSGLYQLSLHIDENNTQEDTFYITLTNDGRLNYTIRSLDKINTGTINPEQFGTEWEHPLTLHQITPYFRNIVEIFSEKHLAHPYEPDPRLKASTVLYFYNIVNSTVSERTIIQHVPVTDPVMESTDRIYIHLCAWLNQLDKEEKIALLAQNIVVDGRKKTVHSLLDDVERGGCVGRIGRYWSKLILDYEPNITFSQHIEESQSAAINVLRQNALIHQKLYSNDLNSAVYRLNVILLSLMTYPFDGQLESVSIWDCTNQIALEAMDIFNQLHSLFSTTDLSRACYHNEVIQRLIEQHESSWCTSVLGYAYSSHSWFDQLKHGNLALNTDWFEPKILFTTLNGLSKDQSVFYWSNNTLSLILYDFLDEIIATYIQNSTLLLKKLRINIRFTMLLKTLELEARNGILFVIRNSTEVITASLFKKECLHFLVDRLVQFESILNRPENARSLQFFGSNDSKIKTMFITEFFCTQSSLSEIIEQLIIKLSKVDQSLLGQQINHQETLTYLNRLKNTIPTHEATPQRAIWESQCVIS